MRCPDIEGTVLDFTGAAARFLARRGDNPARHQQQRLFERSALPEGRCRNQREQERQRGNLDVGLAKVTANRVEAPAVDSGASLEPMSQPEEHKNERPRKDNRAEGSNVSPAKYPSIAAPTMATPQW